MGCKTYVKSDVIELLCPDRNEMLVGKRPPKSGGRSRRFFAVAILAYRYKMGIPPRKVTAHYGQLSLALANTI